MGRRKDRHRSNFPAPIYDAWSRIDHLQEDLDAWGLLVWQGLLELMLLLYLFHDLGLLYLDRCHRLCAWPLPLGWHKELLAVSHRGRLLLLWVHPQDKKLNEYRQLIE